MRTDSTAWGVRAAGPGILLLIALFSWPGPSSVAADNSRCLTCHSARSLSKTADANRVSLYVDPRGFSESSHGDKACTDCHADLRGAPMPHDTELRPVRCTRCHGTGNVDGPRDIALAREYSDSAHGSAARRGDPDAPACKDCHGTHYIRPARDQHSAVSRANIANTCGKCHSDTTITARHHLPGPQQIKRYAGSVHGKLVAARGFVPAAVCTDCHGAHAILRAGDPRSSVNKANVPGTCGACHTQLFEVYEGSIHGRALAEGIEDAPVCTDCHGEHSIRSHVDPASPIYPTHVRATCSKCHESVKIQREYGLPANRLSSYIGSYHGVANKYGDATVANCATCHGAHDIRPSSDPLSAINKKNLPKTCGKCHPNAASNFAKGRIHLEPTTKTDIAVFWVSTAYRVLIAVMMLAFCGYIALDLLAHRRVERGRGG